MFKRRVNEKREILLQAFYNLEDKLTEKLKPSGALVAFTATSDKTNKLDSLYIMARHLSEEGERVLVVDANLREDELEDLTRVYNQRGFVDLLLGDYLLDDIILKESDNFHLLVAGKVAEYEDMYLEPDVIKKFFENLSDRYDYVFLNTKENAGIAEANVFCALAYKTVIFSRENDLKSYPLEESIKELEKAGADILGVIISDYDYKEDELDELFGGN